ncbi:hypothetical protein [Pedobacter sp. GR22-6]|uniref:hypothetical protein n=1 Tax=Pedobacter sp. GR22-6 TaxID=3127957 RepID=UPI00307D788B
MKTKKKNTDKLVKISESALLSLVAYRLKDRVLFPEKVESSREFLKAVTKSTL